MLKSAILYKAETAKKMSDDLISRQETIEALKRFETQCWEDACFKPLMADARIIIQSLPPARVEKRKVAQWIICPDGYYPYCSGCNEEPQGGAMTRFCPNCGARMTGKTAEGGKADGNVHGNVHGNVQGS
ncbi:MAG: hypothetical protein IIW48_08205 [Clostridia bacterium]|nr:hypothetical protein [Clostridia bacterium]